MTCCNDVRGPPLWALPLVHSPKYLSQLWGFAEEAKRDDLFVPLEFDSEWESASDSDVESSSDHEDMGLSPAHKRLFRTHPISNKLLLT